VMIHGLLHLVGYKDSNKRMKEIMTKKENDYLELFHG
jgi:ssRNA-specific RNase YbeY (16S rRNA maturation enzyme)